MKIRLLADYWQQRKKDADGNVYYVRRTQGDEFEVSEAEARHLLRDNYQRPMAQEVEAQQQQAKTTANTSDKK